jgi:membrane protein YdbS with pleckstrin-like domain
MGVFEFKELFERSDASGSRSTILKPLTWFLSVIITGLLLLIRLDGPEWIIIMFAVIICLTIVVFFFTYIYCLFNDKDTLRSEKYSIQKLAIEKGILGDNTTGIINESSNYKIEKASMSNKSDREN